MNGELLLGIGSLATAFIALGATIWQIRVNAAIAERANSLPVASDAFDEFRSQEFQDHLRRVWNEAPSSVPEDGFQSLPAHWRDSAYKVAYFFEYLGILVAYNLVSEDIVVDFSANLIARSWHALEPFIQRERMYRKRSGLPGVSTGFVTHFEHLVGLTVDSNGNPVDSSIHAHLNLRRLTRS